MLQQKNEIKLLKTSMILYSYLVIRAWFHDTWLGLVCNGVTVSVSGCHPDDWSSIPGRATLAHHTLSQSIKANCVILVSE